MTVDLPDDAVIVLVPGVRGREIAVAGIVSTPSSAMVASKLLALVAAVDVIPLQLVCGEEVGQAVKQGPSGP